MAEPNQREEKKNNIILRDFAGVNTQSARQVIGNNEFAWLENVMPVGRGNLAAVPAQSAGILGTPLLSACYYMAEGNINNTDYMFMFSGDGSAQQVNLTTNAVTQIGPAGTFSGSGTCMAQWKNERIVIADPVNGYFDWDGTTLTTYMGTIASVTIGAGGNGFTSIPTITPSGGSPTSAATFTPTLAMDSAAPTSSSGVGINYQIGDVVYMVGGTYTTQASITVTAVGTNNAITGGNILDAGVYTVAPANPVSVTGGHGSGATYTLDFTIGAVAVTTPGAGYTSAPTLTVTGGGATFSGYISGTSLYVSSSLVGSVTIGQTVTGSTTAAGTIITAGTSSPYTVNISQTVGSSGSHVSLATGGSNAVLTANLAINTGGTSIAVYASRVWIAFDRTIVFSAPDSYSDFNPNDLAGSLVMTDSTLKAKIKGMVAANNYLYVLGGSSVNIISNVTVTTPTFNSSGTLLTPAVTTFSNTNITENIGTEQGNSIVPYFRTLAFMVDYGVMGLTGSTPQKMSDALDGVFPNLNFATFDASGGIAVINSQICLCFLVQLNTSPLQGSWQNAAKVSGYWVNAAIQSGSWVVTPTRPLLMVFWNKKWFFASQGNGLVFVASAAPDPDVPALYGTDGYQLYKLFSNTSANVSQTIQTKLWDGGNPLVVKQVYKAALEFSCVNPASIALGVDTESGTTPYSVNTASLGYYNTGQDVSAFGNYCGLTITSSTPQMKYTGLYLQTEYRTQWNQTTNR